MENCLYSVLHTNDFGMVTQYNHCDEVQVLTGNLFTRMTTEDFLGFKNALHKIKIENDEIWVKYGYDKKLFIKTPVNNVMIAFNQHQFVGFLELLDMASLIIESKELVK